MTGGEAFIFDPDKRFDDYANPDTLLTFAVDGDTRRRLRSLIERHLRETNSPLANALLANWDDSVSSFLHVRAKEAVKQQEIEKAAKAVPTKETYKRKAYA
jgi:glutamate synthase domain-containing protein 3